MGREDDDFNKMEIKMSDDMPLTHSSSGGGAAGILGDVPAFQSLTRQKRRQYLAGALCAAGFLFILVVYLIVSRNGSPSPGDSTESAKEAYDEYPAAVRAMIDKDTDPCQDFYQYSCGKWRVNADIPRDKPSILASFSTIEDNNELVLKDIMGEHLPLIGELYSTCMNTTVIDSLGVTPLRSYLSQIAAVADKKALFTLAGTISKIGPNFLTGLSVQADAKDATVYLMYATQQGLSLPDPNYYTDDKQWATLSDSYTEFLTTLFTLGEFSETDAAVNAKLVIAFEQQLAKVFIAKELLMDPVKTYNPVTFKDAIAAYPHLMGAFLSGTEIPALVANNTQAAARKQASFMSVETPDYFLNAEKLVAATPLSTLKVMLAYHVLRDLSPSLSEPFLEASFEFFGKKVYGQQQRTPRWKLCLRRVVAHFPNLMGKYYFIKKFDSASEQLAKTMVASVEAAMTTTLKDKVDWLDDDTKDAAIAKMKKITNLIGHTNKQENFPFSLSLDSYWKNIETLRQYEFKKAVGRVAMTVDREEWAMPASEVNAYYNPATNQIVFPAGILQSPIFDKTDHPSMNFGAIGAIIGHEITHGFDDNGRYYDGDGNLVDWWGDKTDSAFKTRAQCLVNQYSKFEVVSDIDDSTVLGHVNGNFTLGENIADNGGIKLGYEAMETYLFDRSEEDELKDTSTMSRNVAEKLYFISFAQAFCSKFSDAAMIRRLNSDPHSPEKWRVNGAMMNYDKFASAFECSAGSPMAPKTRCEVW